MQKFKIVKTFLTLHDAVRHQEINIRPDRLAEMEANRTSPAYIAENGDIWYKVGNEVTILYPKKTPPFFDAARDVYLDNQKVIIGDVVRAQEYFEAHGMSYFKMRM